MLTKSMRSTVLINMIDCEFHSVTHFCLFTCIDKFISLLIIIISLALRLCAIKSSFHFFLSQFYRNERMNWIIYTLYLLYINNSTQTKMLKYWNWNNEKKIFVLIWYVTFWRNCWKFQIQTPAKVRNLIYISIVWWLLLECFIRFELIWFYYFRSFWLKH